MNADMSELTSTLLALKGSTVAVWLAGFFVLERIWPAAPRGRLEGACLRSSMWRHLGDPARLARNGGLWLINAAAGPLVVVPLTVWAGEQGIGFRPVFLSSWAGFVCDLIVLDLWIYWWHRANHESSWLWRFHGIHHLDRFLDSTSAGRFHLGEVILSVFARTVPIVLLNIPLAAVLLFESLILLAAIFHHSNLLIPRAIERALNYVIITPSIHWVHHHAVRRDTDSNYGTIMSIWDRLFGTASTTQRSLDMTIGVEGEAEEGFTHLLFRPFRPRTR